MFFRFRASDRGRGGGVGVGGVHRHPVGLPLCRRYWGRRRLRRRLNSVCNACAKMEDNFDPETAEGKGGGKEGECMRNISGDDHDDVAFRPLIRTRDERKGVERRRTDSGSRVVKIPDATAAANDDGDGSAPRSALPFSLARNVE